MSNHPAHYQGYFPSPIAIWTSVAFSVGLTPPKYCSLGTAQSKFAKADNGCHTRDRQLQLDNLVLAKNHGQGPPWIPGKIPKQSGAVTFMGELTNGTIIRRHLDQLKLNMTNPVESESEPSASADVSIPDCTPSPEVVTHEPRHSSRISHPSTHFSPDDY